MPTEVASHLPDLAGIYEQLALTAVVALASLSGRKKTEPEERTGTERRAATPAAAPSPRESDALYQKNRVVARVIDPQVDEEAKEIRFGEVYQSDWLLLPDACEFQKYVILVDRIAYATNLDPAAMHKGRILREVSAKILGYREC